VNHDVAEAILRDEFVQNPGPQSTHALGELLLTDKQFDKAIDHFKKAVEAEPLNPQYRSDLAAALLEKAKADKLTAEREGHPEALAKSEEEFKQCDEQIDKALALDPSLLEALFNRGLLDVALGRLQKANDDWKEYLIKDRTSPWADETRRKLEPSR
jgi:tetratricopeptide (TPR) repeat protein